MPVLKDIDLSFSRGEVVSVIGPNGVGKSTLIHCMNNLLKPTSGSVDLLGKPLSGYTLQEIALNIGYVPCASYQTFPMTVADAVLLGRHPHRKKGTKEEDLRIVYDKLCLMGVEDLAMRSVTELSAGQKQKVMLARGLAQEPAVLMLDEPTSNLDIRYQMEVAKILRELAHSTGMTVIMAIHDLNTAAAYSDEIVMMHRGRVHCRGSPLEVITTGNIEDVYGVVSEVIQFRGHPHVIPIDSVPGYGNGQP